MNTTNIKSLIRKQNTQWTQAEEPQFRQRLKNKQQSTHFYLLLSHIFSLSFPTLLKSLSYHPNTWLGKHHPAELVEKCFCAEPTRIEAESFYKTKSH